jgi:hypothetical protein
LVWVTLVWVTVPEAAVLAELEPDEDDDAEVAETDDPDEAERADEVDGDDEEAAGISVATASPMTAASPELTTDTQPKIRRPLTTAAKRRCGPDAACEPRAVGGPTDVWLAVEDASMTASNQPALAAQAT